MLNFIIIIIIISYLSSLSPLFSFAIITTVLSSLFSVAINNIFYTDQLKYTDMAVVHLEGMARAKAGVWPRAHV